MDTLVWLEVHPGDYESLRRFLGHRTTETLLNFYSGTEAAAVVKRFDAHILEGRRQRGRDRLPKVPRPSRPTRSRRGGLGRRGPKRGQ